VVGRLDGSLAHEAVDLDAGLVVGCARFGCRKKTHEREGSAAPFVQVLPTGTRCPTLVTAQDPYDLRYRPRLLSRQATHFFSDEGARSTHRFRSRVRVRAGVNFATTGFRRSRAENRMAQSATRSEVHVWTNP